MKNSIKAAIKVVSLIFFLSAFSSSCNHDKGTQNVDKVTPTPDTPEPKLVFLKTLKINNEKVDIKDAINLGQTEEESVALEWETEPNDALVSFNPELENKIKNKGVWKIGKDVGVKTLKITVKKEDAKHEYTLTIKKLGENALKISKISCDSDEKSGTISNPISFTNVAKSFVTITVEPSDAQATVEFQGFGESAGDKKWKWLLANGENSIGIRLTKGEETRDYTAKISSSMGSIEITENLNGELIADIPDDFENKALTGDNPTFDAKCNSLLLELKTEADIKEIIVMKEGKKDDFPLPAGTSEKVAEKLYTLKEGDTQFEIFIVPSDALLSTTAAKHLKFKVKGVNNKYKVAPELAINGNLNLPDTFLDNLEKNEAESPLHKLFKSPAELEISISQYEKLHHVKEIKINGNVIAFEQDGLTVKHSVPLQANKTEKVKVEFVPNNEQITALLTWNFKLELGGDKPQLDGIQIESVNDVGKITGELPESLTLHIKDGTNPLYKYSGTNAEVVFSVDANNEENVGDALFKIDKDAGTPVKKESDGYTTFFKHTYKINDLKPHNIEVIFRSAKPTEYSDLTCTFRLQRTANKPKIPQEGFGIEINNVPSVNMPDAVADHLTDGSSPLYQIDGFDIEPVITCFDRNAMEKVKHVRFTYNNESPKEVGWEPFKDSYVTGWRAGASFSMPEAKKPYLLKIELIPNDEVAYEALVYSVNMQSSGVIVDMPLTIGVDDKPEKDNAIINLNVETVDVFVQAARDIIKTVTIEVKNVDSTPVSCNVNELKDENNQSFWDARREIKLVDGNSTPLHTVIVTVTPKESGKYNESTRTYRIRGKKVGEKNAKFILGKDGTPKMDQDVEFKANAEGEHWSDYGVVSVTLQDVSTESKKATVRYAILDPKGNMIDFPLGTTPSTKYKVMQNNNGKHSAEKIELFTDKPTTLKIWVVAEDGKTVDNDDGLYIMPFNPIAMRWSYKTKDPKKAKFTKKAFENEGYDSIVIERKKLQSDYIYIAVQVWEEETGFKPVKSKGQDDFYALKQTNDEEEESKRSYLLKFDVSKLKNKTENELIFKCNVHTTEEPSADCFSYIVKITAID